MKSLESEVKKVKEHEEHYMNKVHFDPTNKSMKLNNVGKVLEKI